MVSQVEVLAIVPARIGSKSIPKKNMRPFAGHPLLAYSIAAGRRAECTTRVIVSTDDQEIAEIARDYGAEVPFMRPAELAQDDTPDLPVFRHALGWLESEEGYLPEVVVQLRPTSPLRPLNCVDQAVEILLANSEADSVRAVVPSGQNPYKMWRINEFGHMVPLLSDGFEEPYNMPRQSLPPTYWQTGHVDAIRRTTITEKGLMSGDRILPLMLPPEYAVDIDSERDWRQAEWRVLQGELDIIRPGPGKRSLPAQIDLIVLDFDGVLTDNRVWVDQEGRELVAADRSDGWGLARLRGAGVEVVVLSSESNPVVAARCAKLGLPVVQGVRDKAKALRELLAERGFQGSNTIYLGNDANDLPCFPIVACALAVGDAHPEVRARADITLNRPGGRGAVRELCDRIIVRQRERDEHG